MWNTCAWKTAKVIPLFKGGDREDVGNYRPVSLWGDRDFLSDNQGGFRKGFSTSSTIADLTDEIFEQVNIGNTTVAAFIDLRKAFDTVNFSILLKKLSKAGVRNNLLQWCRSYLSDRLECTLANGINSDCLPVTCGVPQGSVLGPLFFLVYVNDIQNIVGNTGLKLYADDTVLYRSGTNSELAVSGLQPSLNLFYNWCVINKLSVNIKKTKVMVFGSRQKVKKARNVLVSIGRETLKIVPSYKYLGLTLDLTLNYNMHIASVLRTVLHKMSEMKRYLTDDTAISVYKAMLLPYFDYADVIYDKANSNDLGKLKKLQNKCLKICLGKVRRFSTDMAHKLASTPFLKDRRSAHVMNFMYKRKDKRNLLNIREIRTRAHDAPLFEVKILRCEAFKRSVGYHGSVKWNATDPITRNIGSFLSFKKEQKRLMLKPLEAIRLGNQDP